jgi:hypothetical protein
MASALGADIGDKSKASNATTDAKSTVVPRRRATNI